jgi:hypothetical protein
MTVVKLNPTLPTLKRFLEEEIEELEKQLEEDEGDEE